MVYSPPTPYNYCGRVKVDIGEHTSHSLEELKQLSKKIKYDL